MSKELEVLFKSIEFSLQCIDTNGTARDSAVKTLDLLKQALTPPTVDEVCKALSEWFKTNKKGVDYDVKFCKSEYDGTLSFGNHHPDQTMIGYSIMIRFRNGIVSSNVGLPPHLITMIGKVYESLNEVE